MNAITCKEVLWTIWNMLVCGGEMGMAGTQAVSIYILPAFIFLFILALETRSNYVDMLVWNFLCNPEKA